MKKGFILGSALAIAVGIGSTALAAPATTTTNFADVPAKHWSYDAVKFLAQQGIIDGYGDNTFRGDKTMSRYEMASIVYKAMVNQQKANIAQKALIDKLASEYALEINKVNTMDQRLTAVENKTNLSFKGRLLVQQKLKDMKTRDGNGSNTMQHYFRLEGSAKVDDNTSFGMRMTTLAPTKSTFRAANATLAGLQSEDSTYGATIDRFYATTKLGKGKLTLGRQALELDPEEIIIDGAFFSYDGAKYVTEWNGLTIDAKHGRFTRGVKSYAFDTNLATTSAYENYGFANTDIEAINISGENKKLSWTVGASEFRNWKTPVNRDIMFHYYGYMGYKFDRKLAMAAEYGKNTVATTGGAFWTTKLDYGTIGGFKKKGDARLTLQYWNYEKNAIYTAITAQDTVDEGNSNAVRTWDVSYRYAFSKNVTGKLQYADIKDKDNNANSYDFMKAQLLIKF